jgi:multiple sugar transport system substrate-binding protein
MNPELQAWYQEHVFTPYMQQHPDIKVDLIIYLYADRYTKPEVMMAADTPPDVTAWYQHAFVDKGMFTELTPLAAASKLDPKSFYDLSIEYVTVDNKLWGIPYRVNDYVIYYNKDIFHAAGVELPPLKWDDTSWTWTKFLDIAHRLTQQEGSVTKAFGLGGLAGNNQYPWYYGEHWLTPDRTKVALDPNGPGIALLQQAVNQFLPSVHSGPVGKEAGGDDVFAQGRAAMKEAGTWDLQNFKPKLAFNWGLAPLPRGNRSANTYFADGYSIFKGAKHLDQGWTFIQYLVSPAMQKGINERYGAFPSLTSLEQWSATQQTTFPEAYRAVPVEGLPYGVNPSFEKIKESAAVQSAVDKAFGPVALGQQSAKAAFEAIIPQINAILAGSQ